MKVLLAAFSASPVLSLALKEGGTVLNACCLSLGSRGVDGPSNRDSLAAKTWEKGQFPFAMRLCYLKGFLPQVLPQHPAGWEGWEAAGSCSAGGMDAIMYLVTNRVKDSLNLLSVGSIPPDATCWKLAH